MVTVGSRVLKNRLGKYLDLVRRGEPVRITDRNRPIGCILPLADAGPGQPQNEVLARLIANGSLRLGTGEFSRQPSAARLRPGKSIVKMLAEERRASA